MTAKHLDVEKVNGQSISVDTVVHQLVMTAPMSFSWSMYWYQQAHEYCLGSVVDENPMHRSRVPSTCKEYDPPVEGDVAVFNSQLGLTAWLGSRSPKGGG